ncbi:TetR/AcrR family transcriptional regulator [Actinopolymorpha singaporensis]
MRINGRRAASTAATRRAIIEAGRDLLATGEWRHFTLEAVATRARVTRVTVYNQMGSKHGLLDVILSDLTERAGMDQLLTTTRHLSATAARTAIVAQTCRFWHDERAVLGPLFGLAAVDREVAARLAERERWRSNQLAKLLNRIVDEATIPPRIDAAATLAGIVAVTSFPMYNALGSLADQPAMASQLIEHLVISLTG